MLSLPHYREGGGSGSAGDDRDEEDLKDFVVKSRRQRLERKKRGNKTLKGAFSGRSNSNWRRDGHRTALSCVTLCARISSANLY